MIIEFTITERNLLYSQKLIFDLTILNAANSGTSPRVLIFYNNQLSFLFKSIDTTSLTALEVIAKSDITNENLKFKIVIANILIPTAITPDPTIKIKSAANTNLLSSDTSGITAVSAASASIQSVSLVKR